MLGLVLIALGFVGLAVGISAPSSSDVPHPLALVGMVVLGLGVTLAGTTVMGIGGRRVGRSTSDGVALLAARRMGAAPAEPGRPLAAVVMAAFFTITGTLLRSSNFRYEGLDGIES